MKLVSALQKHTRPQCNKSIPMLPGNKMLLWENNTKVRLLPKVLQRLLLP